MGNRPRVAYSPSFTCALGTASLKFSNENLSSGVRFLYAGDIKRNPVYGVSFYIVDSVRYTWNQIMKELEEWKAIHEAVATQNSV